MNLPWVAVGVSKERYKGQASWSMLSGSPGQAQGWKKVDKAPITYGLIDKWEGLIVRKVENHS